VAAVADLDVVIPTFGRPATANETLRMLLSQETLPKSVIVVNQTPGIEAANPEVQRDYRESGVELIWINRLSPSLCGARNDALRAAVSEICLFLDDDILVPRDLVRRHLERHGDGSGWEAVGGQVWHQPDFPDERLALERQPARALPSVRAGLVAGGPLFGGHFSIRREAALSVGGWDEAFVGSANWEEGDLIHRLREQGRPFVWDPEIWLIHLRLPVGGCRIPGNRSFEEWTKTVNFFLYKYRYPQDKPWQEVLASALRAGPLRRENALAPRRWPSAWRGFVTGWLQGRRRARRPILPLLETKERAQCPRG
jgi:glycosyltransferase involved in cell wall biosynthesis